MNKPKSGNPPRLLTLAEEAAIAAQYKAQMSETDKERVLKFEARQQVRIAIKWRRLTRPKVCPSCGGAEDAIEAHHTDYSKPLIVEWLCRGCHLNLHYPGRTFWDRPQRRFSKERPNANPADF